MPQQDPVESLLRPVKLPGAVKAQLWDAYQQAADQDDLASRLEKLAVPSSVKADLWDLKAGAGAPATSPTVRAFDSVTGQELTPKDDDNPLTYGLKQAWAQIAPLIPGTPESQKVGQAIASGEFLKAIPGEMMAQAVQAEQSRQKGDYVTAARQLILSAVPWVGPMLSRRMDQAQSGEVARSLTGTVGDLAGLAGASKIPMVAAKVPGAVAGVPRAVVGRVSSLNPTEAAAVRYGLNEGVPLDMATATGSKAVRKLQETSDSTLANTIAKSGEQATAARAEAMTGLGRRLASRANQNRTTGAPGPQMTPETAGQSLQGKASAVISEQYQKANQAYGKLAEIEARPEHQVQVAVPETKTGAAKAVSDVQAKSVQSQRVVPERFAAPGAGIDEIFEGVWQEAKASGYVGSKGGLRKLFDEKAKTAYDDAADLNQTAQAYSPKELFEAIRNAGGIGSDTAARGEIARLWEASSGTTVQRGFTKAGGLKRSKTLPTGGFGGVTNVLRRTGGKPLDTVAESLRQDPRFSHFDGPNALLDALDDAVSGLGSRAQQRAMGGVAPEDALYFAGVQPGMRWWEPAGASTPGAVPKTVTLSLPVDMRPVKAALRPVRERWLQTMTPIQREASPGLLAVNNIVDGPDYVSASIADMNLSGLKTMSRGSLTPEMRDISQGIAANAVKQLHRAVDAAVATAGPEAVAALAEGRRATIAKYRAGEVYKTLGGKNPAEATEPTAAYRLATQPRDAAVSRLRQVAKIAPEEVKNIGRALIDELVDIATAGGGFGKTRGMRNKWLAIGPETKKILLRDPEYIADLDKFFLLAERMEASANPSGSGHVATLGASSALLVTHPVAGLIANGGSMLLSKFLHSPDAVRWLVRGMSAPPKTVTAVMSARQLERMAPRLAAAPTAAADAMRRQQ